MHAGRGAGREVYTPEQMVASALDRRQVALRVFYCWAALTLIGTAGSHVNSLAYGGPPIGRAAVVSALVDLGAGVLIAAVTFGNWSSFASMRVLPTAIAIVLATAVLAAAQSVTITAVTGRPLTFNRFAALFHPALLDVSLLFGLGYGLQVFEANRRRELSEVRLEAALARAQVQLLRAQLQPHFLFNSLHAISSRVTSAPEAAQGMIARLGELLRMSMDAQADPVTTLRDEMDFVGAYLDLQQFRFGERLRIVVEMPEEALDAVIPSFLLQPAVENSIRHAVERVDGRVDVGIVARVERQVLCVTVWNSGPSLPDGERIRTHLGLGNTAERLRQLYGDAAGVAVANRPEGGVRTEIRLPFAAFESGVRA